LVGRSTVAELERSGHTAIRFDIDAGLDVRRDDHLAQAVGQADAVVHLAAVLGWHGESDDEFMDVNLLGTWRLLRHCVDAGVRRLVFMSSIDVLGVFKGHRAPDYLPLDDDHPCYPNTSYAVSKRLAEVLCGDYSRVFGLETVVLRPPGVWSTTTYDEIKALRRERPSYEWSPFWEYGAFIDVRDLATAVVRALVAGYPGAKPFGVAADDTNSSGPTSQEWAERLHPDVERRDGERFAGNPHRTLLDNARAKAALGWSPTQTWRSQQA
jgi:nucleoside-diphosphate-sugar epimerase